ncbi:MAG: putative toxin-antitoxin system toxin component, PIN family [Phycisphaerales bacterium]|nr:putative toxin-antitoxin system toxin component, PIN family [Phycisphaerales bacterium]
MTPHPAVPVVYDCNIYFQALLNEEGPAGRCVSAALNGEVSLFLSRFVLDEIRRTAGNATLRAKFRHLIDARVDRLIVNIEKIGRIVAHVPNRFVYPRDPDDAHYVNIALATAARFVVSRDNDLLDLMDLARPEGREFRRQFPSLDIIDPKTLLRELEQTRQA